MHLFRVTSLNAECMQKYCVVLIGGSLVSEVTMFVSDLSFGLSAYALAGSMLAFSFTIQVFGERTNKSKLYAQNVRESVLAIRQKQSR